MFTDKVIWTRRRAIAAGGALTAPLIVGRAAEPARAAAGATARPTEPVFRRFRLGGFELTAVSDGVAMIDGPWPIVGEDRPKEEVEALMRDNLLPPSRFQPGFSPVVIDTGREKILIDAGNGSQGFLPPPAGGQLVANLRAAGIASEQIDVVALTHCHVDHIGGLVQTGRAQFPNARYVVGETEHAFWKSDDRLSADKGSTEYKSAALFRDITPALGDRVSLVKPGADVVAGVSAVAAFGHTPGHLGFMIESGGKRLLVWGDCAHHEVASLAHPEWSAFFDMDKEAGRATRRRIYDMAATERLPVLGYHTSFPSVGFVERAGGAFRWLPVTYQLVE
ncbi:MBL fold metallo-hydrolase [Hansschlegelia zhihuaiae]|uniref:MBL fold metallo-hydrolase n=1 Tax=Hansschlegelia zhihuaiae TaxID=405005 RepID=A0A4Q0MNA3_9HYPH|nr:MBL fold metallo-hydrolase [Hansschlegelia zhihuaiae]RXF75367.1 MBL fold metallo-hydrolase [Hansschlegelia zhihuaiae]